MVRRALLTAVLALGFLAFQPFGAYADVVPIPPPPIPVDPVYWEASRSTPDTSGIIAADGWTQANGGFLITWTITSQSDHWEYTYTISNNDTSKTRPTDPELSHWILEVSPESDDELGPLIIPGSASFTYQGPQTWTQDASPDPTDPGHNNGNSNLPVDLYGIRILFSASRPDDDPDSYVFSFWSARQPVWGDFYAKDGKHDDILAVAWNSDILTEPTLGGPFTGYIPVPDTTPGGGGGPIPEPSSLLLLILGGCGVLASRLRRKP